MNQCYKVTKAIEISSIGKSSVFLAVGSIVEQVDECVDVDLTNETLTEVVVFRSASAEKFCLTRPIVDALVRSGALVGA